MLWTKNQEAWILVSDFLSITLGAPPPILEPNVPTFKCIRLDNLLKFLLALILCCFFFF